jgi:parallel beta-helix repeat protein
MMQPTRNRIAWSRILALGVLLAALAAAWLPAANPAHASTTFTVINTNDSGAGSLRQAITDANATSGADVINFDIPGTGVHNIAPATELPTITDPVTINGYSQAGATPNTKAVGSDAVLKIELSGQSAGAGAIGLRVESANSTIVGLVINRWGQGIRVNGPDGAGVKVVGNFIGTDASGTQDLGNSSYGMFIDYSPNNTIGGTTAAERNVVSGNDGHGLFVAGAGATGNKVVGNYFGTDASGTQDLGNTQVGVTVYYAPGNTIGGTTAAERNVISGNDGHGVWIWGDPAKGNEVAGNYVGTGATGQGDLGNSIFGVLIYEAPDNTIGGTQAGAGNTISGNVGDGVHVEGTGATGNSILSNSISSNDGQGIELVGSSANDAGDADTGANGLQNFPVLSSATTSATSATLQGTLNSTPSKTFRLQFFSNPAGTDEGMTLVGETSVTTDASGNASFGYATSAPVGAGQNITATATDALGNTSEFSAPVSVVAVSNTDPSISNLKPAPGSSTTDRTPTVGAKVTDAETNLAKSNIKLYVDGNRKDFSYDRSTDRLSFTPGTNLSYGKHTAKVVATDASGAVGTRSWSFTVAR